MGSPSACDECGKKFKVFGSKKKCKHCMSVVCKACLAGHLELKHTHVGRPLRRRRDSLEIFDATGNFNEQEDLQFLSPVGSPNLEIEYGDPDASDVEDVSDEEDGDAEEDDLLMTTLSRQSSIEEEEIQFREMLKVQAAVTTWAIKEKQAKMELRCKKKDSYCKMSPVFAEGGEVETCGFFAVSYAVLSTILVWAVFGLLLAAYLQTRSLRLVVL